MYFSSLSCKWCRFQITCIWHKICIFSRTFIWNVLHFEKNSMRYKHTSHHVQCITFFSDFNQTQNFLTDLIKVPIIKSHKNLASGRKVVSCKKAGTQEDLMKLIQAFPNSMKKPKHLHIRKCDYLRLWNLPVIIAS